VLDKILSYFERTRSKEEVLEEDMDRIVAFYEKEGFIDAQAQYTLDYSQQGHLIVEIKIDEGQRYYTEDIQVTGNKVASEEEILKVMEHIKPKGIFSRDKLALDISKIRSLYFDKGYIFAEISEATSLIPETGKVRITLQVEEGGLAYVNKILIEGNSRTRDIVIRRELRLHPGERFDGEKLKRSKERLRNLGYFEDINYDIKDTEQPDRKDLVVEVKEDKTSFTVPPSALRAS